MKRFLSILLVLSMVIGLFSMVGALAANEETISFTTTADRVSQTTTQQVWKHGNLTVTNNKSASTTNVANAYNPVKFYASSELIISFPALRTIVFTCNTDSYATALANSVDKSNTCVRDGKVVTIVLAEAADSFTISKMSAQVRVNSISVSDVAADLGDAPVPVTTTAGLITSTSKLEDGGQYIIVDANGSFAMSIQQNGNNRGKTEVTKAGNAVSGVDIQVVTLIKSGDNWKLKVADNSFLYAASGGNYLRSAPESTAGNNGVWSISITSEGIATIKAQGSNTKNWLRYNDNNDIFSCYESGQGDIMLYKVNYAGDAPHAHGDTNPKDHKCDICQDIISSCVDTTPKDHKCDVCEEAMGGECVAAEGTHKCAYCGATKSQCTDTTPKDHKCDVCETAMGGECVAAEGTHKCAYCDATKSQCVDTTPKDHKCDICTATMGDEHKAADGSHDCAYCGQAVTTCSDGDDRGHECDVCGEPVVGHHDPDGDKMCNDCDAAMCAGEHIDEADGRDHKCDRCQDAMGGECVAAEGTHKCAYCGATKSQCIDTTPKDHKCDICEASMGGECKAAEGKHTCDYCETVKSQCSDSDTDKDHKCDVCGKDEMNDHDWDPATTEAPKTCKICGLTEGDPLAPTSAGLITDISKLQDGDKIVIVAPGFDKAISTTQNANNRSSITIVKTGNTVDLPDGIQIFEVIKLDNGNFALKCVNGDTAGKYINGGDTSKNALRSQEAVDDKATWKITIAADGVATIKSVAGNRDWMRFNSSNDGLFACYRSGQQDISIYKVGYAGDAPAEVPVTKTNIAGIKNAADGDKLEIKGVVTNIYYATIYIQDETGAAKVVLGANFSGKVGDTVVVTGVKSSDGSIVSATSEGSSGMTLTAKETTAANLATLDVGLYVKIAGLTVSKVNTDDDDKITSIEFADGSVALVSDGKLLSDDAIKAGDKVTVTATNAGDGKLWSVSYVVTEAGTGSDDDNTGSDDDDNTGNEGGNTGNEGGSTTVTKPSVQANPVAGTGYLFGLHQANKEKTLFFTGEMDGFYLGVTDDPSKAVNVKMESVDGGYRLYFEKEGKKTYIDIVPRDNDATKVNVILTETPSAVFTYDKDLKTFTTNVVEKTWYLGTYGTYTTISASETWRITGDNASAVGVSQFVAHMYAMTTSNVPSNGDNTLSIIVALMFISAMGIVATVSKKKEF